MSRLALDGQIKLVGYGFDVYENNLVIKIGNTDCIVVSVSDTEILCTPGSL